MKIIWARLMNEPVVVFGVLMSALSAYVISLGPGGIDTLGEIAAILAPAAGSLGVRLNVTPTAKLNVPEDEGNAESKE